MPEALARMRHDSVLSGPARKARPSFALTLVRRLRAFPARGYAGAALTAVLTGIVINALTLQRERHPAPFFSPRPLAAAPASSGASASPAPPPASTVPPAKADEASSRSVLPPERPTSLGAGAAASSRDAIADILRDDDAKDGQKMLLAAQNALIKLGYSLHADGVASTATVTALRDFEHTHALPISTEMTPRLLKRLVAAAALAGH